MTTARVHAYVRGRVQGVGFRVFVADTAESLGLAGSAVNLRDGRVEVVAEGPRAACESLLDAARADAAPGFVEAVDVSWEEPRGVAGFRAG